MTSTAVYPEQALDVQIPLRFSDMDALAHVNNVAVVRLFEEARVRILNGLPEWSGARVLIARQEVEYLGVLEYSSDPVHLRTWATRIGGSSFELSYAVVTHGGVLTSIGATTQVVVDQSDRAVPLSDQARGWLQAHFGAPLSFRGR